MWIWRWEIWMWRKLASQPILLRLLVATAQETDCGIREIVLCWHSSFGDLNKCLYIPDREPKERYHQSPTRWKIYWGHLQECGSGVTYRCRNDSKMSCVNKAHPAWVDDSWKLDPWSTLYSLQVAWEVVVSIPGFTTDLVSSAVFILCIN